MLKIDVELCRVDEENASDLHIKSYYFIDNREMSENDRLARDILAPLAVAELMRQEGTKEQQERAAQIGGLFIDFSAACGGALWNCATGGERTALTLADGFRVHGFGQMSRGGCFVLILENEEEKERAYLVRPSWN